MWMNARTPLSVRKMQYASTHLDPMSVNAWKASQAHSVSWTSMSAKSIPVNMMAPVTILTGHTCVSVPTVTQEATVKKT